MTFEDRMLIGLFDTVKSALPKPQRKVYYFPYSSVDLLSDRLTALGDFDPLVWREWSNLHAGRMASLTHVLTLLILGLTLFTLDLILTALRSMWGRRHIARIPRVCKKICAFPAQLSWFAFRFPYLFWITSTLWCDWRSLHADRMFRLILPTWRLTLFTLDLIWIALGLIWARQHTSRILRFCKKISPSPPWALASMFSAWCEITSGRQTWIRPARTVECRYLKAPIIIVN